KARGKGLDGENTRELFHFHNSRQAPSGDGRPGYRTIKTIAPTLGEAGRPRKHRLAHGGKSGPSHLATVEKRLSPEVSLTLRIAARFFFFI
ncbi:hypothetical protein CEXT_246611, partial [Caerostris extrusa]